MTEARALTTMTTPLIWDDAYLTGEPAVDEQHRALLALCGTLAASDNTGHTGGYGPGAEAFDDAVDRLKAQVRQHLAAEAAQLARQGDAAVLEACQAEAEEFEAMVEDVATSAHFDRDELQRFFTGWCLGHLLGGAAHDALRMNPGA